MRRKIAKNHCQLHFVAQSILEKCWKFQPDSSNRTPVQSDRAKAVVRTSTQLAANRLRAAQTVTLMSNECWSILEITIRCRYSAQEVSQDHNTSVLRNNFWKLVFFAFYLFQNWLGVRATAFAQSDCTGMPFWVIVLKFSALVKNRLGYKLHWQDFFAIFLRIYSDNYGSYWTKLCICINQFSRCKNNHFKIKNQTCQKKMKKITL